MIVRLRRPPFFWSGLMPGVLGCALSVPPARSLIEQSMIWHMVIQMPMLVAGGWFLMGGVGAACPNRLPCSWNRFGLTGFITAQLILAYWMLPLAIDRAVVLPQADALKLLSLIACGALVRTSLERSPSVVQLFFVGYAASMLFSTGIYLATTDRRLCNAYPIDSQLDAGAGIVGLGIALVCTWGVRAYRRALKVGTVLPDPSRPG